MCRYELYNTFIARVMQNKSVLFFAVFYVICVCDFRMPPSARDNDFVVRGTRTFWLIWKKIENLKKRKHTAKTKVKHEGFKVVKIRVKPNTKKKQRVSMLRCKYVKKLQTYFYNNCVLNNNFHAIPHLFWLECEHKITAKQKKIYFKINF